MPLSAKERQQLCLATRKNQPEKLAEIKQKDLERYHARKKLVKDMTPREHRIMKRKWQIRNKKRRENEKAIRNILFNTTPSTPPSSLRLLPLSPRSLSLTPNPSTASAKGRQQVRRDRSKLYRKNIQLQDQIKKLERKVEKYKKIIHRKNKKDKEVNSTKNIEKKNEERNENTGKTMKKYTILSNAVKEHYKMIKDHKSKRNMSINASQFFKVLKNRSKTKLFFVTYDDIAQILQTIPSRIVPLKGTLQVHQLYAQQFGTLGYRILSCFCNRFCSCYDMKTYRPLPEDMIDVDSPTSDLEEQLADITNSLSKGFYDTVYSSSDSENEDKQPLANIIKPLDITPGTSYDLSNAMDKIHPFLIKNGTHLLVKVTSERKVEYTYLGVAKSAVDEEGDVRVMFYRAVDDSGKLFKPVETDVSDVMFENLLRIVNNPKEVKRGRRVLYEFDKPIEIFEMLVNRPKNGSKI